MIVAGAPVRDSPLVGRAVRSADWVVAADSGAESALSLGRTPDLVVGDFDSLRAETREQLRGVGVPLVEYPERKDKTDLHIALLAALDVGASEVTLLGILGGERTDHGLAAVLLLAREEFAGVRLRAVDGPSELHVVRDHVAVAGEPGDYVSLLALTREVHGITLHGFDYPLVDASLTFGDSLGVSNALLQRQGSVEVTDGVLLVVHEHRFPPGVGREGE